MLWLRKSIQDKAQSQSRVQFVPKQHSFKIILQILTRNVVAIIFSHKVMHNIKHIDLQKPKILIVNTPKKGTIWE